MDYFLLAIAKVVGLVLNLYMWIVIASAVLSWVNPDPYNPIVRTIRSMTEPVFYRVRRWLPFLQMGGIDFTPIAILLAIVFLETALVQNLYRLAQAF